MADVLLLAPLQPIDYALKLLLSVPAQTWQQTEGATPMRAAHGAGSA